MKITFLIKFKYIIYAAIFGHAFNAFGQNVDEASQYLCKCLTKIDTSIGISQKILLSDSCFESTRSQYSLIFKNNDVLISFLNQFYINCSGIASYFRGIELAANREGPLYSYPVNNCQTYLNLKTFTEVNSKILMIKFDSTHVIETIVNTDYYLKNKVTWTNPCSYYLTLESTNIEFLFNDYNYHDTIYVDVMKATSDSLILQSKLRGKAQIVKYSRE